MLRKITYLSLALLLGANLLHAQDPQFSQYYSAPLYLNPGFTGITPHQRAVINHRVQWPNLPQAFATYAASYDIFSNELRSGFGIMATTDMMGSGGLRTSQVGLLYSYKVRLSNKWVFSPGLIFGYGSVGIDHNRLQLGDGIEFDGNSIDPKLATLANSDYFDFGSGFLLYNKTVWFGVSAYHLNRPDHSLSELTDRLERKYHIHGGMKLPIGGPMSGRVGRPSFLSPSFVYRHQGQFQQFDFGVNYIVNPIMVGVWYRGVPFVRNVIDNPSQDALVFIMGLQMDGFQFGYSYDFTISELSVNTGGSHEISLIYEWVFRSKPGKIKNKQKFIPCPSFNTSGDFWN